MLRCKGCKIKDKQLKQHQDVEGNGKKWCLW